MRRLASALLLLLSAPAVHAQFVEIYGTLGDVHANNVPATVYPPCPVFAVCAPFTSTTSTNAFNAGGGVTLNFINAGVAKLGLDLRGAKHTGSDGADTALAGVKLTIAPPVIRVRPYIQGSAGYLGTSTGSRSDKFFATEVLGGVDLPILPLLDFRMVEVGAGRALTSSSGNSPTFVTVNTGLVLHF